MSTLETMKNELKALSRYYYDGWVHLLPDVDGIRLLTNDVCELLQKVPGQHRKH